MKRTQSTIVTVVDIRKLGPDESIRLLAEWASAPVLKLRDAFATQLPQGDFVAISAREQLRILLRPGRIEVTDYSSTRLADSKAPAVIAGLLGRRSPWNMTAVGLNHEIELTTKNDARQHIAELFMAPWVGNTMKESGCSDLGASVRLFFKGPDGPWNILLSPVPEDQKTLKVSSNFERKDLKADEDLLRKEWGSSLEALLRHLKALRLATK